MSITVDHAAAWPNPRKLTRNAVVLTAFLVLQKLLALVQQVMIGRVSGLSAEADAFYIAQTVPLLAGALIMVAVTNTLIPILRLDDGRRAMGLFVNILALLALSSFVLWAFAPHIVGLIGYGLPHTSSDTAARMLREMAILLLFQGASGILNALYYRRFRFVIPSIASCLLYIGAIIGVALSPWAGVDSFAWGMVAGGAAQVLLLCFFAGRQEWHRPKIGWQSLAGFSASFLSILVASAASVNLMVDRPFASLGRAGTVTAITIATGLITVPSTMVVFSLNSALLPALVSLGEDRKAFAAMFRHGFSYMVLFLGPANLILFFAAAPIIRLLFHSTRFDADSVRMTSTLVAAYSLGIFGAALRDMLGNVLISRRSEWIAMTAGIVGLAVSILLKLAYLPPEKPVWIAFSTSIATWTSAAIVLVGTVVLIPVDWLRLWRESGRRLALANGLFLGLCLLLRTYFRSQSYVPLLILAGAGAVYLAAAWLGFRESQV